MGALILRYGSINYDQKIDPDSFESNLVSLKKEGFKPIQLSEIIKYIKKGEKPPKKCVHITFDYGYADNFIYAYPILKKYGFFATMFVAANKVADNIKRATYDELVSMNISYKVSELLEKSRYISWFELRELIDSGIFEIGSNSMNHRACFSSKKIVEFNSVGAIEWLYEIINDKRLGIPVFEKKWECAAKCIKDDKKLRDYLADFVTKKGGVLFIRNRNAQAILKKECRKYLKHNKVEFEYENGGKDECIRREIFESKKIIEEKLLTEVTTFCYPWGDYDNILKESVKKACYEGAVALDFGLNSKDADPYALKRVNVKSAGWLEKRIDMFKNDILTSVYSKVNKQL